MSRSRLAALILALLTAVSIWLSAGIVLLGDAGTRIAALPPLSVLAILAVALPAGAWLSKLRLEHAWPLIICLTIWLPFLPVGVGPGVLLWEGPVEAIVWVVVITGLIAARPATVPAGLSNPATAPWVAAAVVAISALMVFSQVRNVVPGGDEPHYLAATQSLLHDGDLKVANNYARGEYLEYFPGQLEPHFLKRSTAGEIYSIHAPGVSAIVLPAFAVAGYTGAVWTMILFAALTAALMWRLAFTVSGSAAAAWIAVCGVCFSAPFFFHTFTIYPEMIGAFCVIAGVWLLMALADGREVTTRTLLTVGALLAVLPWLHSRFAVVAGISGVLIAARLAARPLPLRRIGMFLVVPVLAAVAWFAFFYLIWGSPSPAAAYGPDTGTSSSYVLRGLIGLLFDQQFGVITTAPIYALAIAGGVMLLRSRPRQAIELALIVIPYAVAVASYAMWWGGSAAPARFLVAILPVAALPLAYGYASSRTIRAVSLILLVVSAALILPRVFEDNGRFIYNNRSGVDATLRWLSANVDLPGGMPSVHRAGGAAAVRSGLVWLTGLGAVIGLAGWGLRDRSSGAGFAITGALLACAVIICATIAPGPWERVDRQLVALARFRPSWHTTIIDPSAFASSSGAELLNRMSIAISRSQSLDRVPPGDYIILPGRDTTVGGVLRISVGRNDAPIAEAHFDGAGSSQTLRLPVMARTLNFRADAGVGDAFTLRPTGVVRAPVRLPATRAARYGPTRAFFFDDWAYPERDGFWTRANGRATVVIDTQDASRLSGLSISITAGAVPTTIRFAAGEWEQTIALDAGEQRDVTLPPVSGGAWTLVIRSGAGFRPSEREPGSRDVRMLAAWIAVK